MAHVECGREQDVLDALISARWPDRADDDLRVHVAACAICADVIDVAAPLLALGNEPSGDSEARIPSSAVMWWRAQMRARQEAARAAARPITVAQVIASVAAMAVVIVALVAIAPQLGGSLAGVAWDWTSGAANAVTGTQDPSLPTRGWMLPALIIGVWLVLAPVAIYFAVTED